MTIKQTIQAIKNLPNMTATYNSEYQEYRIRIIGKPEADYFTQDADDALRTARCMAGVSHGKYLVTQ